MNRILNFKTVLITYLIFISSLYSQYAMAESSSDFALPVSLISFSLEENKDGIFLKWVVASEVENIGYLIKRKDDYSDHFKEITSYQTNNDLKSNGNSSSDAEYSFIDKEKRSFKNISYQLFSVSESGKVKNLAERTIVLNNENIPDEFKLLNIYPNPFNSTIAIEIETNEEEIVSIEIINILGQRVDTIIKDQNLVQGHNKVRWSPVNINSGLYFVSVNHNEKITRKKILYIK